MKSSAFVVPPPAIPHIPDSSPFGESHLKLYRARIHAYEASATWENFVVQYHAHPERFESQLPEAARNFRAQVPIPSIIPLIVGDCIHNIRNSIDYLVATLARAAGLPDNNTIFPFANEPAGIAPSFAPETPGQNGRKGRRAGALYELNGKYDRLEKIIMADVRPFDIGNGGTPFGDMLWRINQANNVDKHRLITPTTNRTDISSLSLGFGNGSRMIIEDCTLIGNAIGFDAPPESEENADYTVDVVFSEPTRLAGRPIMSTLVEACNAAAEVIRIFDAKFSVAPRG